MYGCGGVKRPGRDRKSASKFTEHGEKVRVQHICCTLTTAARRGLKTFALTELRCCMYYILSFFTDDRSRAQKPDSKLPDQITYSSLLSRHLKYGTELWLLAVEFLMF
jgi:hypothetical protein